MTIGPDLETNVPEGTKGIGTTAIASIAVGSVVIVAVLIIAAIIFERKPGTQKQRRKKGPKETEDQIPLGN